ncbi:Two-component system sensor histidine kinase [Olavius algarvensis associated proteobacterium Delta 3]|nr:Two-component system sensor histidine kinase [Olavius algarvensis associated proteobacterium Delta 3]CAB5106038.1 Two-component system sensor histidine kinase [Olavius algarvensis associated proteobacterium Delta 3]
MGFRSIGTRLTLWYTAVLTLTFVLLGIATYGLLSYGLSREVDNALDGVAQALASQARDRSTPFLPPDVDAAFRRFFGFSPMDRYFDMRDPRGRPDPQQKPNTSEPLPLSREAAQRAAQGLPTFETFTNTSKDPVRVVTMPVVDSGRVINLVRVGMSLESVVRTKRQFLYSLAAMLPLALILAGGGGMLLARRALRPVDQMATTARRISGEDLSGRLDEPGSGDELDRLAVTLNAMLERLDIAFQQIRQFSAAASHELQTPLTILKGELEVALRAERTPAEYKDVLTSALEEIDRISDLVEGLLLLSRSDAGMFRMAHRRMDLAQVVMEVYERAAILAQKQGVVLDLGRMEACTVEGDPEWLHRLMLNIVDNAIKYTPEHGKVTVSLFQDDTWAVIDILDTGIGLSTEEQERIFNPFYRTGKAAAGKEKGAGLGLSIASSIAQAHGGRIDVDSRPGEGSTFHIRLPLVADPVDPLNG